MIHICGDTHGKIGRFMEEKMPRESSWTKDDILIVTGDFGYVFMGEQKYISEKNNLDALAQKPYTILFVDGNHEGFPFLKQYPEEIRYSAPVRRLRNNIFWLQRGYIYNMEGYTFFVMVVPTVWTEHSDINISKEPVSRFGLKRNCQTVRNTIGQLQT